MKHARTDDGFLRAALTDLFAFENDGFLRLRGKTQGKPSGFLKKGEVGG